jgi:hypothetical protein
MQTSVPNNHRGALFPRIPLRSSTDRTSIPSPADYLLIFSPYTENSSEAGLNYWHNNAWHRLLNETEMYGKISDQHIAQIVLLVQMSAPEEKTHPTDPNNKSTYKVPFDKTIFDSQNGYHQANHEYIIPETGFYEIVCEVQLSDAATGQSLQTFILVNGTSRMSDLTGNTSAVVAGSVVYIAELNKGDRVCGAVGLGNWAKDFFRVSGASFTIVKY